MIYAITYTWDGLEYIEELVIISKNNIFLQNADLYSIWIDAYNLYMKIIVSDIAYVVIDYF